MWKLLKDKWFDLVLVLALVGCIAIIFSLKQVKESGKLVEEVEYIDSTNTYNKIYYENEITDLRKENKELYDSLKKYKKEIDFVAQFKYKKTYDTGIVKPKKENKETVQPAQTNNTVEPTQEPLKAQTYEYLSEPNDTFEYRLRINAEKEPNWYSLKATVKDKFTIVNKKKDDSDINHVTIGSEGQGDISDVTIFKKKEKKKLKDRIAVGPGAMAGYDPINKNWGMLVGVGVTYDLW